jgi:CSLREA domain-containing protein
MRILWLLLALVAAGGHAATFTVTSTADTAGSSCGATCTLRQALLAAANAAGSDTIVFNIPGAGPHRIVVGSTLPAASGVLIDGYTQPGASANSHPLASNAVLRVIVDFGALPAATIGINVSGGSTLRGLAVIAPASNVALDVGTASVSGCWFNVEPDGTTIAANGAVLRLAASQTATVGGAAAADRNVSPPPVPAARRCSPGTPATTPSVAICSACCQTGRHRAPLGKRCPGTPSAAASN